MGTLSGREGRVKGPEAGAGRRADGYGVCLWRGVVLKDPWPGQRPERRGWEGREQARTFLG